MDVYSAHHRENFIEEEFHVYEKAGEGRKMKREKEKTKI